MSDWIKCSERLPDEDSYVVAAKHYGSGMPPDAAVCWFIHGRFCLHDDGLSASNYDGGACISMDFQVTHWMPLPDPPKD